MTVKVPTEYFPSDYAIVIANHGNLCTTTDRNQYDHMIAYPAFNPDKQKEREVILAECRALKMFQIMSVSGKFENALKAAYPREYQDFEKEQLDSLKIIHELTTDWATGHIIDKLLEEIDIGDGKNKAGIADAILSIMKGESIQDAAGKKGTGGGTVKTFLMKLTTEDEVNTNG